MSEDLNRELSVSTLETEVSSQISPCVLVTSLSEDDASIVEELENLTARYLEPELGEEESGVIEDLTYRLSESTLERQLSTARARSPCVIVTSLSQEGNEVIELENRAPLYLETDLDHYIDSGPASYEPPPSPGPGDLFLGLESSSFAEGVGSGDKPESIIAFTEEGEPVNLSMDETQQKKFFWIFSLIVILLAVTTGITLSALHKIEEGSVGIYFKYGALMDSVSHPGIHYMTPFVVDVHMIAIRPQTDTLDPIICVTRDGIQNTFADVQVISRVEFDKLIFMVRKFGVTFRDSLIYDRLKEELRIFCANHTIDDVYNTMFLDIAPKLKANLVSSIERLGDKGIEILNLVVPKPDIPTDIAQNYKQVNAHFIHILFKLMIF